ncbi:DUF5606 domain-containing protein [Flavobacterium sp. NRK F10]|uniref:Uncharacterized protein n=1 Tax=Flavobacterium sediminis TaxID=2201181 RepID=A0A2U8QRE2_9FLAO|nr:MULTISPECIES: DUF5606 domain-containing protein [Flavobacterium]AWM12671.1 hypothetical protein DI487_01480 [Flavobacterium sediminis]MCO6173782.1 DUF5606 domain-containing protein [Flavobacterium sp. NRK F10]
MSIQKILAISGKPGLYELKLQTRTGFVAESLLDGKKITVGMRSNVSLLSEIAVYTYSEEIRLSEVFKAVATKENDGPAMSHKESEADLRDYFREVLPEFDEDRVYTSDIKKILNWYNILQPKGLVTVEALTEEENQEEEKAAE